MHPTAGQHMRQLKDDQLDKKTEIIGALFLCVDLGGFDVVHLGACLWWTITVRGRQQLM